MVSFFLSYTESRIFFQTKKDTEALRINALTVFAKSFPTGSSHRMVKNALYIVSTVMKQNNKLETVQWKKPRK